MGKTRFTIGYLGIVAMMAFGFEMCLIDEIWIKIAAGIIDILALLLSVDRPASHEVDGELYMVPGEDDDHIALGLSINTTPDRLFEKHVATFEIVDKVHKGGN